MARQSSYDLFDHCISFIRYWSKSICTSIPSGMPAPPLLVRLTHDLCSSNMFLWKLISLPEYMQHAYLQSRLGSYLSSNMSPSGRNGLADASSGALHKPQWQPKSGLEQLNFGLTKRLQTGLLNRSDSKWCLNLHICCGIFSGIYIFFGDSNSEFDLIMYT